MDVNVAFKGTFGVSLEGAEEMEAGGWAGGILDWRVYGPMGKE